MKPARAVGIDLGTTFSAIAVFDEEGRARAIPNAEGTLTTPSVVLWHNETFLVGQPALDLVQHAQGAERDSQAAALIRAVKRMIGNPPAGGLISHGHRTSPVEVSAAVLAKLARDASAHLGCKIQDAVITVPAHFGDRERSATKAAAELAGLRVLRMINEPSAAALIYSIDKQAEPGTVLVFDLGGGTFDATVLQLEGKESRVLATQGIEELGGINFTKALADFLAMRYASQTRTPYPQESLALDRLINEAEAAKCRLSESLTTTVSLASPQGQPVVLTITREQFEEIIDLFTYQLQTAVEMALEQAKKTPADISRVLLCGGSSRVPAIQTMLTDLFGRPPEQILDLDLSVALGAAYAAYSLEQAVTESQQKRELVGLQTMSAGLIIDCVSYPVGIAVLNQRGDDFTKLVMLQTGDTLDTWSQPYTVRIVGAVTEFPPISIYKGAGTRLDPADYLGDITLTLPPNTPTGARATIRMLQDQNGLIQVQLTIDGKELPGHLQRAAVLQ